MKKINISLLFVLFLSQILMAQNDNAPFNYYIWGNATYNNIGGDFDGKGTYTIEDIGTDNTVILPEIEPAVGWEIGFGVSKGNHKLGVALGFTKFNTTFEGSSFHDDENAEDANIGYYEANYGYRFLNKKRLNLFGALGIGVNTKMTNGTYEESYYSSFTRYKAININLGINMEYYVTKRLYLNTSVMYKLSNHGMVEIGRGEVNSISGINGSWLSINVGVGVKLGKVESL